MNQTVDPPIHCPHPLAVATADARFDSILTPDALAFLARLIDRFDDQRRHLLADRIRRQSAFDRGQLPDFPAETRLIRESDWKVAPIPSAIEDRRVEITGPVDRKMIINALNSGAHVFMADFEDSTSPTWDNVLDGQVNLRDAVAGTISLDAPNGKHYELGEDPAILMVRPRGLHLSECHIQADGQSVGASLVDFALFVYHNARTLAAREQGPYFYLPKLEHYLEARWWNAVIDSAEDLLDLPRGTIRVTVLIETLPAAFQMDEILYELRSHIVGLNCGRWDYIFSYIKTLREHPDRVLGHRSAVTMDKAFLAAYSRKLVQVCHRRGAHAMGGMAAQIPIKNDDAANNAAMEKVRADKEREVLAGHDGTWVAHPGLIPLARQQFDQHMPEPNQITKPSDAPSVTAEDLLEPVTGTPDESGVRANLKVAVEYTAAWLAGQGCVPIDHLMEDAATAEIARAQVWQWCRHGVALDDGRQVTTRLVAEWLEDETAGADDSMQSAIDLIRQMIVADELADFLTLPAYQVLTQTQGNS